MKIAELIAVNIKRLKTKRKNTVRSKIMAKRRTFVFALFLVFALSLCLFTANFAELKKAVAETDFDGGKYYDIVKEDGEDVYKRNDTEPQTGVWMTNYENHSDVNAMTYSFREDGKFDGYDAKNFGVMVYPDGNSGTFFEFSIKPYFDAAYIYYYPNGKNPVKLQAVNYEANDGKESADFGIWNNAKVVFEKDALAFYINGKLCVSHFDTYGYTFTNPRFAIYNNDAFTS